MAICTAVVFVAGSAASADFCLNIRALDAQTDQLTLSLPDTGETTDCTRALTLSGESQLHCGWAFSYRAPAATKAFQRLVKTVTDCLGAGATVTTDPRVNHPDSYHLQTFELEGREFGVSLKDKASLSKSIVFLRVTLPD